MVFRSFVKYYQITKNKEKKSQIKPIHKKKPNFRRNKSVSFVIIDKKTLFVYVIEKQIYKG